MEEGKLVILPTTKWFLFPILRKNSCSPPLSRQRIFLRKFRTVNSFTVPLEYMQIFLKPKYLNKLLSFLPGLWPGWVFINSWERFLWHIISKEGSAPSPSFYGKLGTQFLIHLDPKPPLAFKDIRIYFFL